MIIKYHPDKIYNKSSIQNKIRRGTQQEAKRYYFPVKGKYPVLDFIKAVPLVGWIMRLAICQVNLTYKGLRLIYKDQLLISSKEK